MDYLLWGHSKSLVSAKRVSSRAELINRIMDDAHQIRNDQKMAMRALMSIVERMQMFIDSQGGRFESARCAWLK